ncbi:signal recognition particle-docking protein FtsY [Sneathia vaginalis]|uniref:signal recognition particle-docking protein FtsY n=1 Tax=Sneathia vaginalis TaxID=187101 RepID=UPI00254A322F|nr:signal recognition particle-docking protein FtsY [Sneathia vaginalis]MDK9581918.1 signal recognition particle-docking protein FtsY [Sneathia vaginalis]
MSLLKPKKGFFTKLKEFFVGQSITDELYEELEELLIQSDMGIKTTSSIIEELMKNNFSTTDEVYAKLEEILIGKINKFSDNSLRLDKSKKNVILLVGVNGVGKTTSVGKIANIIKNSGYTLVIGAADTFRAAAIEQLEEWGKRVSVKVISQKKGTDPAAVVFDTLNYLNSENIQVSIIDTAGRLHNKKDLMDELGKIKKIITNKIDSANIETLLVIDATTGQNGLEQAKIFNEITSITGVILTKYDGTAKGGIIFPIIEELQKPVKFLGVGEGINDLKVFDPKSL